MNIAVLLHQVPDLVEDLEISDDGTALNADVMRHVLSEYDDHALEQAILLKESAGGTVTIAAIEGPDLEETLFAGYARGADAAFRIAAPSGRPSAAGAARLYARFLADHPADLVLTGVQAINAIDGSAGAYLAVHLGFPYVGVVRGVAPAGDSITVGKEYPGGALGEFRVKLPAVLGIQASTTPPRYVPIMRLRQAMKSHTIQNLDLTGDVPPEPGMRIRSIRKPPETGGARMLSGSAGEVSREIAVMLRERGIV